MWMLKCRLPAESRSARHKHSLSSVSSTPFSHFIFELIQQNQAPRQRGVTNRNKPAAATHHIVTSKEPPSHCVFGGSSFTPHTAGRSWQVVAVIQIVDARCDQALKWEATSITGCRC